MENLVLVPQWLGYIFIGLLLAQATRWILQRMQESSRSEGYTQGCADEKRTERKNFIFVELANLGDHCGAPEKKFYARLLVTSKLADSPAYEHTLVIAAGPGNNEAISSLTTYDLKPELVLTWSRIVGDKTRIASAFGVISLPYGIEFK